MSSGTTSATHSPRTSDIGPLVSDDEALKAPSRNNCKCSSPVSIFRAFDGFANSTITKDEQTKCALAGKNIGAIALSLTGMSQVIGVMRVALNILGLLFNLTIGALVSCRNSEARQKNGHLIRKQMNSIVKGVLLMLPGVGVQASAGYDKLSKHIYQKHLDKNKVGGEEVPPSGDASTSSDSGRTTGSSDGSGQSF